MEGAPRAQGRLDPAVARGRRAVADALDDLAPGTGVLLGVSGGADSLALAALTAFAAPRRGLDARVLVVDHGLQEGSASVARDAADAVRQLGLEADVEAVEVGRSGGPESAARSARRAALASYAHRHGCAAVLLAHTRDDQAETVLLGLARGAGARSLAGMAPRADPWRRPLLTLTRAETEAVRELSELLQRAFLTRPADDWIAAFQAAGVPVGPIKTVAEVLDHDPHVKARDMVVELEHPVIGKYQQFGVVPRLMETPGAIYRPAPLLGEHNEEIYLDELGMTNDDLVALRAEGVI